MKSRGLTLEEHLRPIYLSTVEDSGIPGVEVKFVDIRRNTGGEGGYLGLY